MKSARDDISLFRLATVLLKSWKLVTVVPVGASVLAAAVTLLIPPKFRATTTFVPEEEARPRSLPSGLAGLASEFGIGMPGNTSSPQFYADLLASRTIRDHVLEADFPDPRTDDPSDRAALLDMLDIRGDSHTERLERAREVLDDITSVRVDDETGVVLLSVKMRFPALAAAVANRFVALLSEFNLETRQSNVTARRLFIEERLTEAEAELRSAEEDLQSFLERNRQFRGSPQLEVQYERLQRRVTIKQEVLITLRRQYEEARIQEVNDTPLITVIDRALPPEQKSTPKGGLIVGLVFILASMLAVLGALATELVDRAREESDEEYQEFASSWARTKAELRSLRGRLLQPLREMRKHG